MAPNVSAVLQLLAKGPASLSAIEQALAPFALSPQGVLMLLSGLIGRELITTSQGLYSLNNKQRRDISPAAYARVVHVWLALADGAPHSVEELFGTGGAKRALLDKLISSGLCEEEDGKVQVSGSGASTFQTVWADERIFCEYVDCPSDHADAINSLLSGQGTLPARARLICSAAACIGLNNVARRIGIGFNQANHMVKLDGLPKSVRSRVTTPSQANVLSKLPDEQAMLAALDGEFEEEPEPEPEQKEEPEPDMREVLAATLKLAAATFEMAADTQRKINWIAKELGWKGD